MTSTYSRREVLFATVVGAGSWCLGLRTSLAAQSDTTGPSRLREFIGAYLEFTADGRISIVCPQSEMGQGVHDALPRIVAEELDAEWTRVDVVMPRADPRLANPVSGRQLTGDSASVRQFYSHLRRLGAASRHMLVSAAASHWNVAASECRTARSEVWHPNTRDRLAYAQLWRDAALITPPSNPELKSPRDFTLIGASLPRKDTPEKVSGERIYGADVQRPGMRHAVLRRPQALKATLRRMDDKAARAMPGVDDIFLIDEGIAVVARTFWQAHRAAEALDVEFDAGPLATLDDAAVARALDSALERPRAEVQIAAELDRSVEPARRVVPDAGRVEAELAACKRQLDLRYEAPYFAHLNMEPQCCTCNVTDEHCEIWAPHQNPGAARETAARLTGLPLERVTLNVTFIGTGFGRKWEVDALRQCLQIAMRRRGTPIKLMWTREQDVRHDFYRPAVKTRTRIGLGDDGLPRAVVARLAGQSILAYQGRPIPGVADPTSIGDLIDLNYAIPHRLAEYAAAELPVPVGFWRSVQHSHNVFFRERAIDEAALLAKRDPYEYRLALLAKSPRGSAVMARAAQSLEPGRRRKPGHGVGVAFSSGFGSFCAHAIEVSVDGTAIRILRAVAAVDCGVAIDPGMISAQIEGGTVFGLSAAASAGVSIASGAIVESNFHDQPVLRMNQLPPIEVHIVRSEAAPGGVGETGVPSAIAALANAVSHATRKPVRKLPLSALGFTVVGA